MAALLISLGVTNLLVWGGRVFSSFPVDALYSTGTVFGTDGTIIKFSDKLKFKDSNFSLSVKYNWHDKRNVTQTTGTASQGLRGEWLIAINHSLSFGPSLLGDVKLDDDFLFPRSYLQGGEAYISLLPLSGELSKSCYYFLFLREIYCGSGT
ncbi:hypothetical protein D3C85_1232800 [compost metagenome]